MSHADLQSDESDEHAVSLELALHHRLLDGMLDHVEMTVEIGNWSAARAAFARFQTELEAHMRLEEELMFPAFETFTRASGGPTAVLRAEHGEIRGLVGLLEELLGDEQSISEVSTALEVLLAAHGAKEERTLFPLFERHAAPEVYAALDLELAPLVGHAH